MKVNAKIAKTFSDQGITFPSGAVYQGEQLENGNVVFDKGTVSSFRHEFRESVFASVTDARQFEKRDEDADIRNNLPKVYVTPKLYFEDQGVGFPPYQIQGYYDEINEQICFPTGSLSSHRHRISFKMFSENLKALYSPLPESKQPGENSDPNKTEKETSNA